MSIYELEIGRADTASARRALRWELSACDDVLGVFLSPREDVLTVLFAGDRWEFDHWASTLSPGAAVNPQTHQKGASR